MKFLENISDEDVVNYARRKDPKNKNSTHSTLRVPIIKQQYDNMMKLEAYMKKEHDFNLFKSEIIKIAIQYLFDNVEDEDEFLKLLEKHYMI